MDRAAGGFGAVEDEVFDLFGVDVVVLQLGQDGGQHARFVVVADDELVLGRGLRTGVGTALRFRRLRQAVYHQPGRQHRLLGHEIGFQTLGLLREEKGTGTFNSVASTHDGVRFCERASTTSRFRGPKAQSFA